MPSFMAKMAPREQIILIVVVVLGALAAVVFLLLKPQVDMAAELRAEQVLVEDQIAVANNALTQAQSIKDRAKENRIRLSKLREAIPENDQIPALIVDLPQLAADSGVELGSFTPSAAGEGGSTIAFQMSATGTFFDTLDFLYRIQNFPRYLKVSRVAVEKSEGGDGAAGGNILRVNVDATSYYGAPVEEVAATGGVADE